VSGDREVAVVEAGASDRERWEAFVAAAPDAELGHLWSLHDVLAARFGAGITRLVARAGSEWLAVLPLALQRSVLGRFMTSMPYVNHGGVLGRDPAARALLATAAGERARRLGVDRLELRGKAGDDLPLPAWHGKHGYVLELPPAADLLWGSLTAKLRSQVRRAGKAGWSSRIAGGAAQAAFYDLFARRWHELGSPVLPRRFFDDLERALDSALDYVLVERDGEAAAAGVLVETSGTVEIPWAASALEHNRDGVNMLLYWTALERAVARGARRFDFGRSSPDAGNARFKLQWGAREIPLGWNVWIGSARGRAAERGAGGRGFVATLWRRMPGPLVRQVGPLLAARIPY
jgi:FemAB-related protein (PEP-CTERM system-associated)